MLSAAAHWSPGCKLKMWKCAEYSNRRHREMKFCKSKYVGIISEKQNLCLNVLKSMQMQMNSASFNKRQKPSNSILWIIESCWNFINSMLQDADPWKIILQNKILQSFFHLGRWPPLLSLHPISYPGDICFLRPHSFLSLYYWLTGRDTILWLATTAAAAAGSRIMCAFLLSCVVIERHGAADNILFTRPDPLMCCLFVFGPETMERSAAPPPLTHANMHHNRAIHAGKCPLNGPPIPQRTANHDRILS